MRWIEIITVRSSGTKPKELHQRILEMLREVTVSAGREIMKIYFRSGIDSDISLHLQHDTNQKDVRKSTIGLQLAEALKITGLVNHSIWIEERENG